MTATDHATLERVIALRDEEIALRERARALELIPHRREAARALFLQANGLRKARLALLQRCELL